MDSRLLLDKMLPSLRIGDAGARARRAVSDNGQRAAARTASDVAGYARCA
jgi:hypothetical protein